MLRGWVVDAIYDWYEEKNRHQTYVIGICSSNNKKNTTTNSQSLDLNQSIDREGDNAKMLKNKQASVINNSWSMGAAQIRRKS
jgi:hypothetical protein